jgi:hypothetical protein
MADAPNVDFDSAVLAEDKATDVVNTNPRPKYGSDGWQDYVLSQLRDDEAVKVGDSIYPKCAGLRRLAELLLGDIVFMGPTKVFPSGDGESAGRVTVVAEVHIVWSRAVPLPITLCEDGLSLDIPPRVFAEVSDVWSGNTPEPFVNHAAATAASKALSRALKNALALNVHTAEEMAGKVRKEDGPSLADKTMDEIVKENANNLATRPQLNLIKIIAGQIGINPAKLVQDMYPKGDKTYGDNGSNLTKSEASDVINKLNKYKTNDAESESIPDHIRVSAS